MRGPMCCPGCACPGTGWPDPVVLPVAEPPGPVAQPDAGWPDPVVPPVAGGTDDREEGGVSGSEAGTPVC